jgi:hypothetical protein
MLLGHLLVFALPFVSGLFKGLDFTLVVAGFDVGLSESAHCLGGGRKVAREIDQETYFSFVSLKVLSALSASSSSSCSFRVRDSFCWLC